MDKPKLDIDHLSRLANVTVSPGDAQALSQKFKDTIDYVDRIKQIALHDLDPTHQVTGQQNVFRPDQIDPHRILSRSQALKNAPQSHRGYFVVKAVLHE